MSQLDLIKYILFDLDGTIIDTTRLILYTFRETFRLAGIPVPSDEVFLSQIGRPLHLQMRDFHPQRANELCALYQRIYDEHFDELSSSFPGVEEALRELKQRGYVLGVVTSKRDFTARRELYHYGMNDLFALLISADYTKDHKPHPAPLLEALKRLRASPHEAVYIGDSPFDIKSAHQAAMAAGAVVWGPFPRDVLEKERPDFWIGNPQDLLNIFPMHPAPGEDQEKGT